MVTLISACSTRVYRVVLVVAGVLAAFSLLFAPAAQAATGSGHPTVEQIAASPTGSTTHNVGCSVYASGVPHLSTHPSGTCAEAFFDQNGPYAPILRLTTQTGAVGRYGVFLPPSGTAWKSTLKPISVSPGQLMVCVVSNHHPYLPGTGTYDYATRCKFEFFSSSAGWVMRLTTPNGHTGWSRIKSVSLAAIHWPLRRLAWA